MERDIVDGNLGNVGNYDLEFKGGHLVLRVGIDWGVAGGVVVAGGDLEVKIGADALIEVVKKAIPGKIDDAILDVLKVALTAVP